MAELTKKESAWLDKFQTLLDNCPSERLGFFTIGYSNVIVYDNSMDNELDDMQSSGYGDFCSCVKSIDAQLGELVFPSAVLSTAG